MFSYFGKSSFFFFFYFEATIKLIKSCVVHSFMAEEFSIVFPFRRVYNIKETVAFSPSVKLEIKFCRFRPSLRKKSHS